MRSTSSLTRIGGTVLLAGLLACLLTSSATAANFDTATPAAPHRGVWEIELSLDAPDGNPFFDVDLHFIFTLPHGKEVKAEGFHRGGNVWTGRAYCAQTGLWHWRSVANRLALDGQHGTFEVKPSELPGKLRIHPEDPRPFAFDNGEWFLHLGDTAYRFVTDTEPLWQQYLEYTVISPP